MNCRDFLARHSEYVDGAVDDGHAALLRAHAERCPSCARYDRAVRRGAQLAREFLRIEVSSEFEARVRHRLYHVRDDLAARRVGATAVYAAAASILLLTIGAGALAIAVDHAPAFDTQAIEADAPPALTALAAHTPLTGHAQVVEAVPALPPTVVHGESGAEPIESEAKGHDPHVATAAAWPVYSRRAVAVAFPGAQASVVVSPADFRQARGSKAAGPLIIRH